MKKKIVLIAIACLIVNNAAVIGAVETPVNTSSPVVRAAVFQTVSFARLPYVIMINVLQGVPFFPEYKQPTKNQNQNKHNNSRGNKCFFLSNTDKGIKLNLKIDNNDKIGTNISQAVVVSDVGKLNTNLHRDWTGFICIFLLVYLVLLSRSNLPWEIIRSSVGNSPVTLLA